MEGKMTEVLAKTTATAKAVEDLKTLLTKYMGRKDDVENDTPSVSKSQLDSVVHILVFTTQVHVEDALPVGGEDVDHRTTICAREDTTITGWDSGQRGLQESFLRMDNK
jgi:hypothetical protein